MKLPVANANENNLNNNNNDNQGLQKYLYYYTLKIIWFLKNQIIYIYFWTPSFLQDNTNNNNFNMASSDNSNQNMNMIIPGRSIQRSLSLNAINTSLQTFTGLAFIGALNIDTPPANQNITLHSILCSSLGNADHENQKGRKCWNY